MPGKLKEVSGGWQKRAGILEDGLKSVKLWSFLDQGDLLAAQIRVDGVVRAGCWRSGFLLGENRAGGRARNSHY